MQRLLCPITASEQAACHPDDDLALKLFWGRQRGLAVIFAADAEQWAQRYNAYLALSASACMQCQTTPLPHALRGIKLGGC